MPDIVKIRDQLNKWMDEDQRYSNPRDRERFQDRVWPFINKNIDAILSDSGERNNGDYPSSSFAAWLLVQHMDAFPDRQQIFLSYLSKKLPKHVKYNFLSDRVKVNQWILRNYRNSKYYKDNKPLSRPTVDVRDPNIFSDAKMKARSRQEALDNAKKANNFLLVDAVINTGAMTQPSYTQS